MKIFGRAGSAGSCWVRWEPGLGKFTRWAAENSPSALQTKPVCFQNKQRALQAPAHGAGELPASTGCEEDTANGAGNNPVLNPGCFWACCAAGAGDSGMFHSPCPPVETWK